jgi:hypothetical protein
LRYCRSRFFTFLFFTQKLSGTSSGKNNKSCGIFHHESKKLGLQFSDFSTIFYAIYKNQQKHFYYFRFAFAAGTLESFGIFMICPWLTKNTLETLDSLQCRPWGRRPARAAQFRRARRRAWPGKVGRLTRGSSATGLWAGLVEKGGRRGGPRHSQAAVRLVLTAVVFQRRRRRARRGRLEARPVMDRTARGWARTASVRHRRRSTPRHSLPGDSGRGISGRAASCRVIASGRFVAPGNVASGSALALGARAGAQMPRQHGVHAGAVRRGATVSA